MEMKKHLEQKGKAGKRKPKLQDIDSEILPAAWSILRWWVLDTSASHPYHASVGVSLRVPLTSRRLSLQRKLSKALVKSLQNFIALYA
jgi:hypothetical protein